MAGGIRDDISAIVDILTINFSFPCNIMVSGESQSGKTTLLNNILNKYGRHFEYFIIFSETIKFYISGPKTIFRFINKNTTKVFEFVDPNILSMLYSNCEKRLAKYNHCPRGLIIFDDFNSSDLYTDKGNIYSQFFKQGRHLDFSSIFLSQVIKGTVPPFIRNNCRYHIVTSVNNDVIDSCYGVTNASNKSAFRKKMIESCVPRKTAVIVRGVSLDDQGCTPVSYSNI